MSESGFSGLPQGGRTNIPNAQNNGRGQAIPEQTARITDIPDNVRTEVAREERPVRLRGEVTRVNDDGSVQIRTSRGDVEIQLPPDTRPENRPQQGQRLEIEVQPPPQQAQSSQVQPQNVQIQTAPWDNAGQSAPTPAPPLTPQSVIIRPAPQVTPAPQEAQTRTSTTPINVEVNIEARPAQTPAPPPAQSAVTPPAQASSLQVENFPQAGSLIRLTPVSAEQVVQLLETQLTTNSVVQNVIAPVIVSLNASVQAVENALSAEILRTPVPPPITPQAITTTPEILNTPPVFAQESAPRVITLEAPPILRPFTAPFSSPPQIAEQAFTPSVLFTPQVALAASETIVALTAPQVVQPSAAPTAPLSPQAFDARISVIDAPGVQIVPPAAVEGQRPALPVPEIPPPQNQPAGQITGIVVAKTEAQLPVLSFLPPTAFGVASPAAFADTQFFALTFPSDSIPLGTQIQVTPQAANNIASVNPTAPLPITLPLSSYLAPQSWPVMNEIQQSLLQAAPQIAQAFTAQIATPSAPAQFGAAALFFISVMRGGGDLNSWLGERAIETLRQSGKGDLLTRLGQETTLLNRAETVSGEWRGMNIPVFSDGEIHKIALHYRQEEHGEQDDSAKGPKAARFVFDLDLSAMGKVQVDGLFRPVATDGPRLDVILRTEEHFSGGMQAEMRRVYMDALRPTQIGGELSFQNARAQWVTIQADEEKSLGFDA